jgi:hypothetical protein
MIRKFKRTRAQTMMIYHVSHVWLVAIATAEQRPFYCITPPHPEKRSAPLQVCCGRELGDKQTCTSFCFVVPLQVMLPRACR